VSERSAEDLHALPLVTLHLTDRCNSRCISCDYWRHGQRDMTAATIAARLPELRALGTRTIMITGGEPLVHPQWFDIAYSLRAAGIRLWLHTSGVSLVKHADRVAQVFDAITVSLDGIDQEMYAAVRGVDAFEHVCAGIRCVVPRVRVSLRTTVQRANYFALPRCVDLAHALGATQISFLAADVSNPHAFGRTDGFAADIALQRDDLTHFAATLDTLEREYPTDFASGFIAERPHKLRRLLRYYAAHLGLGPFPPVRCNAPEFSAVLTTDGGVHPCFFIEGPARSRGAGLGAALNDPEMRALRAEIREGRRPECKRCVCSLWRDPTTVHDIDLTSIEAAA